MATPNDPTGCIECGDDLPDLNGSEENDFSYLCEICRLPEEKDRDWFDSDWELHHD